MDNGDVVTWGAPSESESISKWRTVMERLEGFGTDESAGIELNYENRSLRHPRSTFLVDYLERASRHTL